MFLEQSEYILRIIVAGVCGSMIGYERTNRNKEAGIRTHAIVAVGAALIIVVSKYGFSDTPNYDASRVSAQIVSGIGFLGAGIIFLRNRMVSGLTTAAGIWTTGGIGMAIGSGLYYIGIMASVIVIFIQIMMHKEFFNREMERDIVKLKLSNECNLKSIQDIVNQQENYHTEIIAIDLAKSEPSAIEVTIEVALKNSQSLLEFIDLISEDSRVQSIKGSRG